MIKKVKDLVWLQIVHKNSNFLNLKCFKKQIYFDKKNVAGKRSKNVQKNVADYLYGPYIHSIIVLIVSRVWQIKN